MFSFAQGNRSFAQNNSQSCFKVLKDHGEMTGLLIKISSSDLSINPYSDAMHLYVKQLRKKFIMSFNVNNIPLAPCYQQRTSILAEVKK